MRALAKSCRATLAECSPSQAVMTFRLRNAVGFCRGYQINYPMGSLLSLRQLSGAVER